MTTSNAASLTSVTSNAFNILPATTGLLADIATSDADFNHIDGFDVLFGNGSGSLKKLQATNPGTFHYELDLRTRPASRCTRRAGRSRRSSERRLDQGQQRRLDGRDHHDPGAADNSGSPDPGLGGSGYTNARPRPSGPTAPSRPGASGRPVRRHGHRRQLGRLGARGNCLATSGITWITGQPANNAIVKCVKVEGLEIPKKHEAHIHLNLEFALKGTDGWQATAQTAFRAGFSFKSQTQVTLDADFPIASLADMT